MHERKNSVTYYRVGRHIFTVKSVGLGNGTSSALGNREMKKAFIKHS